MARGKKGNAEKKPTAEEKKENVEVVEEKKAPFTDYFEFNEEVAKAIEEGRVTKLRNGAWRVYNK